MTLPPPPSEDPRGPSRRAGARAEGVGGPALTGSCSGPRSSWPAGLPGAHWWVADDAGGTHAPRVELDEVAAMYTEHGFWSRVFDEDS